MLCVKKNFDYYKMCKLFLFTLHEKKSLDKCEIKVFKEYRIDLTATYHILGSLE